MLFKTNSRIDMTPILIIKQAETLDELNQILDLQSRNHVHTLTAEERSMNGFVTVRHDLELLTKMNDSAKQIIAVDDGKVVGYALVMLKEFGDMIPVLVPMFEMFNTLSLKGKSIQHYSYYVMGQICISENYRGRGIFEALYQKHKEIYSNQFELLLTEVSTSNARSMKAHSKVGFNIVHSFKDETDEWNILVMALR